MKIPLDKSRIPSGVTYFDKVSTIELEKVDLFKLGIFKHEVPPTHIHDSDYFYLMSKVPAYIELYSDFITVSEDSIINTSTDDRIMKDVSEIIGIALGLKCTMESFEIRQEEITKVPPPIIKAKYLDYNFQNKGFKYELETKGTTSNTITKFVEDITAKKADSTGSCFRFGTVAVISKPEKDHATILHLCDDPPNETIPLIDDNSVPWHYIHALGYILDNKYYNEITRSVINRKKISKAFKSANKRFFGSYEFNQELYLGEFFDYRLNMKNLSDAVTGNEQTINSIYRKVTRAKGKKKIFIGIHSHIVELILKGADLEEILKLDLNRITTTTESGIDIFRDSDGIITVIASDRTDPQIEKQFPEEEVKVRLRKLVDFERHNPTTCGEPCRSREKQGKSCEIKTYRGACHFHR